MRVTICDRCDQHVTDPTRQIEIAFNRPAHGASSPTLKYRFDLCPDCFEEIQRWLAGYAFEVPAKKEGQP